MSIFEQGSGYSTKVIQHFENPRNLGTLDDADASAKVGSAVCGDIVKYYLKIENERIKDIKFKSYGCASNIATSSILTEMVKGKPLKEAKKVDFKDVEKELGGLPNVKMHCAVLSTNALQIAIAKYEVKKGMRRIDEAFCRKVLQGVMDPITGENIFEAGKVEELIVNNAEVIIKLAITEDSESTGYIREDIIETFEGIDVNIRLHFNE